DCEALAPIRAKGKSAPISAYRVHRLKGAPGRVRGLERQGLASRLVGRDREVATLRRCVERLMAVDGGIVGIIGDAGLGKSRLLAEVRGQGMATDRAAVRWLEGQTLSFGRTIGYGPFRDILRAWAGIGGDDDNAGGREKLATRVRALVAGEAAEVLPSLASLLALDVDGPGRDASQSRDSEARRKQIF